MEKEAIYILDRSKIEILGIKSVIGFDEEGIYLILEDETLTVGGENLHVEVLELEEGRMVATGRIISLIYEKKEARTIFLDRFRR